MVATRRGVDAYRWELALVAVTAVWGSTFVLVRDAVAQVPPFTFIAYRFLAAALLLAAIRPRLAPGNQVKVLPADAAAQVHQYLVAGGWLVEIPPEGEGE